MKHPRRHLLLVAAASLVACGGHAAAIATSSSPFSRPGMLTPTAAVVPARLWLWTGGQPAQLALYDTRRRTTLRRLPAGVVRDDWQHLYALSTAGVPPRLQAYDMTTGTTLISVPTESGFALPTLGPGERPDGLSPNGRWLTLAATPAAGGSPANVSRFLVYDTAQLEVAPRSVNLRGDFTYDGVSNDGRNLFLLETTSPSGDNAVYHVRRYDLVHGALDPNVIADKRTGETSLSGDAVDRTTSADGSWQYTVYAFGEGAPMVHALNLSDAVAFCVDLPKAPLDQSMDLLWGLARSHDGRYVLALNAGNGAVVRMTAEQPWEERQATFTVPAPATSESWIPGATLTAEAKRIVYGAAVISADDRTLYGLGDLGVFAVDTATLKPAGPPLIRTQPLTSLVMSEDGRELYATSLDSVTPLLQVSPQSGRWAPVDIARHPLSVVRASG
jgi:hypothetical protein